jgi:DNA-binding transcriptional LysR family regulator
MDAADLRVFEAVARLGGMNRAAGELNTVQSAVTARIRALEAELGRPLFARHARGVVLTAAGQRLLPYAVRVRQVLVEAQAAVRDEGEPSGPLTIGSLETTAALRLSPVLAEYAGRYPAVSLVFRTGTTAELVRQVLDRTLDGAFVAGPVDHPALDQTVMFREELVLVTAARGGGIEALRAMPDLRILVLRAGCSYRQRLEDVLARRGIVAVHRLEFGTLDAIFGCIAAGLGVTLMPRAVVDASTARGRLAMHPVSPGEAAVDTLFVRRHDGLETSALRAFLECTQAGLHSTTLAAAQ